MPWWRSAHKAICRSSVDGSDVRKTIAPALAVLAISVASAEIATAAFCFWREHRLPYRAVGVSAVEPATNAASIGDVGYRQRLHPYFGFTGPYSRRLSDRDDTSTNSLGFAQHGAVSLPYVPRPHDVVIAVFGGSVAANLVLPPRGGANIARALEERPELSGKHAVVINMAQGAGKQPQQLIELSFLFALGQHIDVVLNLDGFNEFALGLGNVESGMHPVMPAGQLM